MAITPDTTVPELAARVSQALEKAGIIATLSGGGAVSIYSENEYESSDLDFITHEGLKEIAAAPASLGFRLHEDRRHLEHPGTDLFLVPTFSSPLHFGVETAARRHVPGAGGDPTRWCCSSNWFLCEVSQAQVVTRTHPVVPGRGLGGDSPAPSACGKLHRVHHA